MECLIRLCVRERERECVCMCVCVRGRERERVLQLSVVECLIRLCVTEKERVIRLCVRQRDERWGGLGSRPKKMYGERLGDGVEYHLMSPTPRR